MTETAHAAHTVLITASFRDEWVEQIQQLAPGLHIEQWPSHAGKAIPQELWQKVEILYTSFATPLPLPEQTPHLRWVQLYSAGADRITDQPLFHSPVVFTTASGVHAVTMAEYVLTVALAWYHRLPRVLEQQQRGQWPSNAARFSTFASEELYGKTIGIVGYGSIGRQTARLASGFGMRVLAMQRGSERHDRGFQFSGIGDPAGTIPARYYQPSELHLMLNESDVVLIAVPLTAQTRGMFDDAAFGALKPTAFLVNVARGEVCDEGALLRALTEKRIAGAALDVFAHEPLPPDHPFWRLSNILITPHVMGLTTQYDQRASTIFIENLRRHLAGESLYNVVDKALGY